jgi:hypothetical protein
MGRMKDLHITIHNGGDEAVAAVERIGKEWREQLEQAASEIEGMRLTGAEREAIEKAISRELDSGWYGGPEPARVVTLRYLLDRLA